MLMTEKNREDGLCMSSVQAARPADLEPSLHLLSYTCPAVVPLNQKGRQQLLAFLELQDHLPCHLKERFGRPRQHVRRLRVHLGHQQLLADLPVLPLCGALQRAHRGDAGPLEAETQLQGVAVGEEAAPGAAQRPLEENLKAPGVLRVDEQQLVALLHRL